MIEVLAACRIDMPKPEVEIQRLRARDAARGAKNLPALVAVGELLVGALELDGDKKGRLPLEPGPVAETFETKS